MNWYIIAFVGLIIILLIIFLIRRNQKDEKELEDEMNTDITITKERDSI